MLYGIFASEPGFGQIKKGYYDEMRIDKIGSPG